MEKDKAVFTPVAMSFSLVRLAEHVKKKKSPPIAFPPLAGGYSLSSTANRSGTGTDNVDTFCAKNVKACRFLSRRAAKEELLRDGGPVFVPKVETSSIFFQIIFISIGVSRRIS